MYVTRAEEQGRIHLPQSVGNGLPNTAQEAIGHLCHKGTLLAQGQLDDHQDATSFYAELLFSQLVPSLSWCLELFLPRCGIWFAELCEPRFSHHKSTLTAVNHPLIPNTFGKGLQANLLHHIPQE